MFQFLSPFLQCYQPVIVFLNPYSKMITINTGVTLSAKSVLVSSGVSTIHTRVITEQLLLEESFWFDIKFDSECLVFSGVNQILQYVNWASQSRVMVTKIVWLTFITEEWVWFWHNASILVALFQTNFIINVWLQKE